MAEFKTNVLYYGDNLEVLRQHFPDECVDLIYLDPPFNSNRSYNLLFKESSGAASDAQLEVFEDTWEWGDSAAAAYDDVQRGTRQEVARMLKAMVDGLGHNQVTAYLCMMAPRLIELHRALKATGSLYFHCDPTASHYLKLLLDATFDATRFRNEIIWKRTLPHGNVRQMFGRSHDIIFFYCKGDAPIWSQQFTPHRAEYLEQFYRYMEPGSGRQYRLVSCINPNPNRPNLTYEWNGVTKVWKWTKERMQHSHDIGLLVYSKSGTPSYKAYLDTMTGTPMQDIWEDIPPLMGSSGERLGYPTQKPLALLERVINASSKPGDIVLDPFCGCGTAVHAAQKLERRWIGIDVTYLAIGLVRRRMESAFAGLQIEEIGAPRDLTSAQALAFHDKYQFQWWVLDWLNAQPVGGSRKKGADHGIDGLIPFFAGPKEDYLRAVVSVKGGEGLGVGMVRDLVGVLDREKAPVGILITLGPPTQPMITEAAAAGIYHNDYWQRGYPRIQIITVEQLLHGKRPDLPQGGASPFAQAPLERERAQQGELLR